MIGHQTISDDLIAANWYFARLNEQMNMIGHQTISDDLIAANWLIFTKNCQKLAVIIFIFEYLLFVDAAIDNVIDT